MKRNISTMLVALMLLFIWTTGVSATDYVWVTEPVYDYIGLPGSVKAPFFTFEKGGKGGYLDGSGAEMSEAFEGVDMTGAAFYHYSDGGCYAILNIDGETVLLSPDGTKRSGADAEAFLSTITIVPEDEIIETIGKTSEGAMNKTKIVTYKKDGQMIFAPLEVLNAGEFHSGVAVVETEKNQYAILDKSGILTPQDIKLNLTGFYYEDLCIAEKDGKFGLVKLSEPHCISVRLNGRKVYFDQLPIIDNDRTLVPVRAIFEALGAEVSWNGETRTVTATKDGKIVSLKIDDVNATVDGKTEILDVPAKIVSDRTMVPVRFIAQSFGAEVNWEAGSRTVVIAMN